MAERATEGDLEKAVVQVLDGDGEPDRTVEALFNPTEYDVSKSISYGDQGVAGMTSPLTQFVSGDAATLSVELLFDTHEERTDVREHTGELDALVEIDSELHAPPRCRFVWGTFSFTAVVESLDKQFTLFLGDGTPTRARVTLSFREYATPREQREAKPRHSADRTTTHRVTQGDTLYGVAADAYDDPGRWRPIARRNDLENPRELEPGTVLVIPPLE